LNLKTKIFADCADKATMLQLYKDPRIQGFTTNPTLMRKAGVTDYEKFARDILESIPDRPVSLEVFADDFSEMERQARKIASWSDHVNVKIPVTNTHGKPSLDLIRRLNQAGVKINVTALLTLAQVEGVVETLKGGRRLTSLRFRRAYCGYRPGSGSSHGIGCARRRDVPEHRTDLGKPA